MTNIEKEHPSNLYPSEGFPSPNTKWTIKKPTACIVFADGKIIKGVGLGATGSKVGEICFNTSITGYQEILTDPSYLSQIVTFTFPHIGNVGANSYDIENYSKEANNGAVGAIFKCDITDPANYRSTLHLNDWLKQQGIIAIAGVDTRALTHFIRQNGAPNATIAHDPTGDFDYNGLQKQAQNWSGLNGLDLAEIASAKKSDIWNENSWCWQNQTYQTSSPSDNLPHIVVIDYGIKRNILRLLRDLNARITIVNAKTRAEEILALNPDGIFLSNGPGDPAATGKYAIPILQKLFEYDVPIFGICLGHQLIALAVGAKTIKMKQGHRGANHPVKDHNSGKVEIVSMNHGFAVDSATLPNHVIETHTSLFDNTNCGLSFVDKDIFSVQHHPEASPGPQDSYHLFKKFKSSVIKHYQTKSERSK